LLNATIEELLQPVYICQTYCKNKSCRFLWPTVYNWVLFWWRRSPYAEFSSWFVDSFL